MQPDQPSSSKIILMGELIVNLPVTIIIILCAVILFLLGLSWNFSLLIAVGIGWFSWSKLLNIWIAWALERNVSRERLYRLSKRGLINFYRYRIFNYGKETNKL